MTCETYYESHEPYEGEGDRCNGIKTIDSETAAAIALMAAGTTVSSLSIPLSWTSLEDWGRERKRRRKERRALELTNSLLFPSPDRRRPQPLRYNLGDQALGSQVGYAPPDALALLEEHVPDHWK